MDFTATVSRFTDSRLAELAGTTVADVLADPDRSSIKRWPIQSKGCPTVSRERARPLSRMTRSREAPVSAPQP
jgi:hypothetical protein